MKRTIIIGQSLISVDVDQNIFHIKYEEDILEEHYGKESEEKEEK